MQGGMDLIGGDAAIEQSSGHGASMQVDGGSVKPAGRNAIRKPKASRVHNMSSDGSRYTDIRTGYDCCIGSFAGRPCTSQGVWCSQHKNKVHQCYRCLGHDHGGDQCRLESPPSNNTALRLTGQFAQQKGKSKGTPKGKKGKSKSHPY